MAFEKAAAYLRERGFGDRILTYDISTATVELAAAAVGTEPARIAKSMTFKVDEGPVMILCAGDGKVSSSKFKAAFHTKAKMLTWDEVHMWIGHDVGGVCPFAVDPGVKVYLDESLKRFDTVYPACGNDQSAVRLSCEELEQLSGSLGWVDVCSIPE